MKRRKGANTLRAAYGVAVMTLCLAGVLTAGDYTIFPGDGSEEAGFVPPPQKTQLPPAPPRTVSSAETFIPYPPPPVVPMSRTEAKKPPRPPVMFTKLQTEHVQDWGATPNDVNNLLKRVKSMMDVNYVMEIRGLGEVNADPEGNPILFRTGHYHFEFTPEERAKLRAFLLNGGMIIFNTGLGSKPFYDSAARELQLIFPEVHLQRLSSDHPVFHAYYDLDHVRYRPGVFKSGFRGDEPWFDGITINCRTVAVISRWCMAVGWEENEDDSYQAYVSEDSQKLGVNLFTYATAQRAWAKQAAGGLQFVDEPTPSTDRMFIAQVVYDGEWKTRHAGLSVLLQSFNAKTEVPVKFGLRELRLTDPTIFDAPLLYLTGHENFTLRPDEVAALREYLRRGGFLFGEACCGRKGFDLSFHALLREALPEHSLAPMSPDGSLFSVPNPVTRLGVTPALAAQLGTSTPEPRLLGVDVDGHCAVLYSPFGMAGGWEMSQNPYAHGYNEAGAILLGQNVLMYALTQ